MISMHTVIRLLIIGISSNLDNLVVGLAYGIRGKAIPPLSNMVLAGIAFAFTVISALAGSYLRLFLSDTMATVTGAVIILAVGLFMIVPRRPQSAVEAEQDDSAISIKDVLEHPERADRDNSGDISVKESLLLGVVLALNCLTNSMPAGLWKVNVWVMAGTNALFSYLSVWGGVYIGKRFGHLGWLENKANSISGFLLVLLGFYQLCFML